MHKYLVGEGNLLRQINFDAAIQAVILWLKDRCPGRIKWPADPLCLWAWFHLQHGGTVSVSKCVIVYLKTIKTSGLIKYDNLIKAAKNGISILVITCDHPVISKKNPIIP